MGDSVSLSTDEKASTVWSDWFMKCVCRKVNCPNGEILKHFIMYEHKEAKQKHSRNMFFLCL